MLPMGCGMEGYIELKPGWNGSLEAMEEAATLEEEEAGPGDSMAPGVGVPPFMEPIPCPLLLVSPLAAVTLC